MRSIYKLLIIIYEFVEDKCIKLGGKLSIVNGVGQKESPTYRHPQVVNSLWQVDSPWFNVIVGYWNLDDLGRTSSELCNMSAKIFKCVILWKNSYSVKIYRHHTDVEVPIASHSVASDELKHKQTSSFHRASTRNFFIVFATSFGGAQNEISSRALFM